jgi:hypothetical protein
MQWYNTSAMMEDQPQTPSMPEAPASAPLPSSQASAEALAQQRKVIFIIALVVLLVIAGAVASIYFLLQSDSRTEHIRDIFIIMIAAQTLLLGFVLVILIVQLARLINLLQNEIRPILESTNETTRTLKGTAAFLSEHLAEPVIKLNEYVAALTRLSEIINPGRGKRSNWIFSKWRAIPLPF